MFSSEEHYPDVDLGLPHIGWVDDMPVFDNTGGAPEGVVEQTSYLHIPGREDVVIGIMGKVALFRNPTERDTYDSLAAIDEAEDEIDKHLLTYLHEHGGHQEPNPTIPRSTVTEAPLPEDPRVVENVSPTLHGIIIPDPVLNLFGR